MGQHVSPLEQPTDFFPAAPPPAPDARMAELALGFELEIAEAGEPKWPMGRTIGVALAASAVLWASLVTAAWLLWRLL